MENSQKYDPVLIDYYHPPSPRPDVIRYRYKESLRQNIISPTAIHNSFDNFPYYLSDTTKDALILSTCVRFNQIPNVVDIGPRLLLSGPAGSEIYQETLVKALAKHFDARLLVIDFSEKAFEAVPTDFYQIHEKKTRYRKYFIDVLSEIACSESKNGPLIIYLKNTDKNLLATACAESTFEVSSVPRNALLIASSLWGNQYSLHSGENQGFSLGDSCNGCQATPRPTNYINTPFRCGFSECDTGCQAIPKPKDQFNTIFHGVFPVPDGGTRCMTTPKPTDHFNTFFQGTCEPTYQIEMCFEEDFSMFDHGSQWQENPKRTDEFSKFFPHEVRIQLPRDDITLSLLSQQLEQSILDQLLERDSRSNNFW